MAKTSKAQKSDRQKLIEEAMKKQKGAEKRRGNIIVATCVVASLAIVGAAAYSPIKSRIDQHKYADVALDSIGAPASVCQSVQTKAGADVGQHIPEGTSANYTDAPPAFGPHWNVAGVAPAPFTNKFYDSTDRPALEALVHNLEHGYTILWYDSSVADNSAEMTQVKSIASKFKSDDTNFRLKFIAAPWLSSDEGGKAFPDGEHVAFTHWSGSSTKSTGVTQYCSSVSGAALGDFMTKYPYTDAPEAGVI